MILAVLDDQEIKAAIKRALVRKAGMQLHELTTEGHGIRVEVRGKPRYFQRAWTSGEIRAVLETP